jgi:hypothetical protein
MAQFTYGGFVLGQGLIEGVLLVRHTIWRTGVVDLPGQLDQVLDDLNRGKRPALITGDGFFQLIGEGLALKYVLLPTCANLIRKQFLQYELRRTAKRYLGYTTRSSARIANMSCAMQKSPGQAPNTRAQVPPFVTKMMSPGSGCPRNQFAYVSAETNRSVS